MIRASDEFPSFFEPRDSEPLIIDCGANIGVSVLEWKTRWPMSRIICFEPDPDAFRLLTLNMERNDIPGVQCIHAAVADFDGETLLFGDMGPGADARGNSIQASWGGGTRDRRNGGTKFKRSHRKATTEIQLSHGKRIAVSTSFTATRPERMATECQCKSNPIPCLA